MLDKYIIAKYMRLSLEDGDKVESESIANQRDIIDDCIIRLFKDKEIETIELIDDGYSGTNLNRPSVKKLLILAETKGIDCIIVKDFSRFARDYIEVGRYIDLLFPEWQIRFISINDGYDSRDYIGATSGIDVALKNIAYTMYSRDLSEKIKSVRKIKYERGEFISPYAPYGYMKDENIKNHLVIDPEASKIVKWIFEMKSKGMSNQDIAITLNRNGVLSPTAYKNSKGISKRDWSGIGAPPCWGNTTIMCILKDERYTGKMVSFRFKKTAIGSNKIKKVEKENQYVVENTHEAIVSQALFDAVQVNEVKCKNKCHLKTLFSGLLRCGNCKHALRVSGKIPEHKKYTCKYRKLTDDINCLCEYVLETELIDIVRQAVEKYLSKAIDLLNAQKRLQEIAQINRRKIQRLTDKISGFKTKKVSDYVKLARGNITDDEFQTQQECVGKQIAQLELELAELKENTLSDEDISVLDLFQKYIGITDLSNDMLSDLIKAIYVYNGKRVEIVWNFKEKSV